MADVKPLGKCMEKFVKNGGAAGPDYKDGVLTTKKDQAECAIAAEPSYEEGVTAAIGRKAFSGGLRKSGHKKWQDESAGKGAQRYPGGMRAAGPAYTRGFSPYHAELERIVYPPKGPRGSPANIERVRAENEALHNIRIGAS